MNHLMCTWSAVRPLPNSGSIPEENEELLLRSWNEFFKG